MCSDHGGVLGDGHGDAEPVLRGRIRSGEFLLLRPGRPRSNEDVRASTITPTVIIVICSDHGVLPGDGHADAEQVTRGRIRSGEFLLLRPGRPRSNEDVRAATISPSVTIGMCSDHGGVPGDGHSDAELVT